MNRAFLSDSSLAFNSPPSGGAASLSPPERIAAIQTDRLRLVRVRRPLLQQLERADARIRTALELCDRSGRPCDRLRAQILRWRSACYRRQRDWDAARADVERALELAEAIGDRRTAADAYVQASLVAERSGDPLPAARRRGGGSSARRAPYRCARRTRARRPTSTSSGRPARSSAPTGSCVRAQRRVETPARIRSSTTAVSRSRSSKCA
jgi:hypothetical protein